MERVTVTKEELTKKTGSLMRDMNFLVEVAEACDRAYYEGQGIEPKPLFTQEERDSLVVRVDGSNSENPEAHSKLATNLPGFYALQEATFFLAETLLKEPTEILENIISEDPDEIVIDTAMRFAHATWLTGTGFRNRMTRDNVMPFDLLPEEEKQKDKDQIVAAAKVWLDNLNS